MIYCFLLLEDASSQQLKFIKMINILQSGDLNPSLPGGGGGGGGGRTDPQRFSFDNF